MNGRSGWPLLLLAGALVALAIYAGPNQGVALAASAGALAATALFLLGVAWSSLGTEREEPRGLTRGSRSSFQVSLAAGRSGRSEVVVLLDELDRRYAHPDRPLTSAAEVVRLRGLSRVEFRAFVAQRLDEIEGGAA